MAARSKVTAEERQRNLIKLSAKYMRGEISLKDFKDAERLYTSDYHDTILELSGARRRLAQTVGRLFSMRPAGSKAR